MDNSLWSGCWNLAINNFSSSSKLLTFFLILMNQSNASPLSWAPNSLICCFSSWVLLVSHMLTHMKQCTFGFPNPLYSRSYINGFNVHAIFLQIVIKNPLLVVKVWISHYNCLYLALILCQIFLILYFSVHLFFLILLEFLPTPRQRGHWMRLAFQGVHLILLLLAWY